MLEIHFDNPGPLKAGTGLVDNSGVRVHVSKTHRTHQAAGMTLGDPFALFADLPAGEAAVVRSATCPGDCTSESKRLRALVTATQNTLLAASIARHTARMLTLCDAKLRAHTLR